MEREPDEVDDDELQDADPDEQKDLMRGWFVSRF